MRDEEKWDEKRKISVEPGIRTTIDAEPENTRADTARADRYQRGLKKNILEEQIIDTKKSNMYASI